MLSSWSILALTLGYVGLLFLVASLGERLQRNTLRPLIYALSLAVYCSSWTYFGSVGLASTTGYNFVPVYLGPILLFGLGTPILLKIVRLAKGQGLTSVSDFIAARYGKSQPVAATVTIVCILGALPYIGLQLQALVAATNLIFGGDPLSQLSGADLNLPVGSLNFLTAIDGAFVLAMALAAFAVMFGTRQADTSEHQSGLMLAVATESLFKLAAFLAVGLFALYGIFMGPSDLLDRMSTIKQLAPMGDPHLSVQTWTTLTVLSFCASILLPRQFHVAVVESTHERDVKRARWTFPVYLVLINLFVVPIAAAGLVSFDGLGVERDMYVLALPMAFQWPILTAVVYVGGVSAATAMVVVESVALAIMVSNSFVLPLLLRGSSFQTQAQINADGQSMASTLLAIRRGSIVVLMVLAYGVFRALGQSQALVASGLISFAATAQLAPAFFLGLMWRGGTAAGAIAGIVSGFAVWTFTLIIPWMVKSGIVPGDIVTDGLFGLSFLRPQALFGLELEPLAHGAFTSLLANSLVFVGVSLLASPKPIEVSQARLFVSGLVKRAGAQQPSSPQGRAWRTPVTVATLQSSVARYLGVERTHRSFKAYAASLREPLHPLAEADPPLFQFADHLLTSAIGAPSARLVLTLLLQRHAIGHGSARQLLDDASDALEDNVGLLQSALDQVRGGLCVFDKDFGLKCWNRQYREALGLPPEFGRFGVKLEAVLRHVAAQGDFGPGKPDALVADRMHKLCVTHQAFQETIASTGRVLNVQGAAMPQGGIVVTFTDVTELAAAARALASSHEVLERRVVERTMELLDANRALSAAKAVADTANLDKTRFLAAASHDILQPLSAAKLYTASLADRPLAEDDAAIVRHIDTSLQSVEEIFNTLSDISRLDSGRMVPAFAPVSLAELFRQLEIEFRPLAREKGLKLTIVPSSVWVHSDRKLLRRVLQNLVSNAIKYTSRGSVLLGARRRDGQVSVEVLDTGAGIDQAQHAYIFKEFTRLEETANIARGIGLGLSIVERMARVLRTPISLQSVVGQGSRFIVGLMPVPAPASVQGGESPADAAHRLPEVANGEPASPITGAIVLCIDNEPEVLSGMYTLLSGWGCRVMIAGSPEQAVESVHAFRLAPDVILADYHLDAALTGLDAIAAVSAAVGYDVPAIVITADPTPDVHAEVRKSGASLMRKPVRPAALRSIMTQIMLRRMAAAAE